MKKILIIEDNRDLADNTYLLLKESGYNTFVAYNGIAGLKLYQQVKPDIVLCDIMLPDWSGYKILNELKKIKSSDFPIFIFLTAKTQRADLRKGMELGADDYITKPFTYEELLNAISTQIEKRESFKARSKLNSTIENENKEFNNKLKYNDNFFIDDKKNPGFYPIHDIIIIKSMKDYVELSLAGNKKFIIRKPMIYWEKILPEEKFIRIHRQTIVNLDYIEKVEKASSNRYSITMKHLNKKFEVSQRYKKNIKQLSI